MGSIPGLGRSPGEGNGNPLQYFCLENFTDRGVWGATVHGVTKSQTEWLSLFSTGNYTWYLVVTYNGENSGKEYIYKHIYIYRRRQWHPTLVLLPGKSHGRRSLVGGSPWGHTVGHDWATSLSLFTFTHWRRKWQPTPVFLPGESQGRGCLVGCRLWGRTESDTTEVT